MTLLPRTAAWAISALLASTALAQAQSVELIYNTFLNPFEATRPVAVTDFAKRIEAESGGDIKVTIPDTSLAPINQQYEMVLDGVADLAIIPTNEIPQIVSLNRIAELPQGSPSATLASEALWQTYKTYFEPIGEYRGLVVLSTHVLPGRQLMSIDAPLSSPSSFAGKKIWAPRGPMSEIVSQMGGVVMSTNFPDLQEYVSKKMIDGLLITPDSAVAAVIHSYLPNLVTVPGGLGSVSLAVVMSAERWESLSEEQRAAILRAAEGLPTRTGGAIDAREAETLAKLPNLLTQEASEELMATLGPILDAQVQPWLDAAKKAGLADPEAVLASYRALVAQ